jgi:hypothetical protein
VWPFPLEPNRQAQLEALGYVLARDNTSERNQRFCHQSNPIKLHAVDAGSELWTNYLVTRDYLRHDEAARAGYSRAKQTFLERADNHAQYETAKDQLFGQMMVTAHQWWIDFYGFMPVQAVVHELSELTCPWYIASGWALDLFLGRVTRVHHDVDVVIARTDQLVVQHYLHTRGWKFVTPFAGKLEPWPPHMRVELPRHQVHAHRDGQFIDILLSDIENGIWRYRREPAVLRAVDRISLLNDDGVQFLAPELALLFKSKNTSGQERLKDIIDYQNVREHLKDEPRAWLRWALSLADSKHPWISELA